MPNWSKSAPDGGWKEQTYYVVEVTFKPTNPPHIMEIEGMKK